MGRRGGGGEGGGSGSRLTPLSAPAPLPAPGRGDRRRGPVKSNQGRAGVRLRGWGGRTGGCVRVRMSARARVLGGGGGAFCGMCAASDDAEGALRVGRRAIVTGGGTALGRGRRALW